MKIRLTKETNHVKDVIWFNIEKWNGSYWDKVYSTMDSKNAIYKFDKLKQLDSEITIETIEEFEKKVTK